MTAGPAEAMSVVHRRYLPATVGHYGGGLVDGAFVLGVFGDVATEICVRLDGDEGLFAGYDEVRFLAPVRVGDVLEARGDVVRVGGRSRQIAFEAAVTCRTVPQQGPSAAEVLAPPLVVVRATGTVVVPAATGRSSGGTAKRTI